MSGFPNTTETSVVAVVPVVPVVPVETDKKGYVCYLLVSVDEKKTYVGITNNMGRRLRQHNGVIVGGAKTTSSDKLRPWSVVLFVSGFRSHVEALQFEWAVHHPRRKGQNYRNRKHCVLRRLDVLKHTLAKEKWTRRSPLASDVPLSVHFENKAWESLFASE